MPSGIQLLHLDILKRPVKLDEIQQGDSMVGTSGHTTRSGVAQSKYGWRLLMRKIAVAAAGLFTFALSFIIPREASAIPAFSRQTGMSCTSCHFQHFPTLNSFGRAFKGGGYTMAGGQSMIEGDFLSLPSTLNASFVTKIRYQKRNGDTELGEAGELNKGSLQFPDKAAFLLGGRVGTYVGFLFEASLKDTNPRFISSKMPFVFGTGENANISVTPFTTDGFGPAYGLELLNTGAARQQRVLEHRTETSAQQYIGTSIAATGLTVAAINPLWFANYTIWANEHATDVVRSISSGPFLHYGRIAFTPTFAGWDLAIGGQLWNGTEKNLDDGATTYKKAEAWAVDAQAQGSIGPIPVGLYLTYARAAKSAGASGKEQNLFNTSTARDKSASTITGEVGVIPGRLTVAASYRDGQSGAAGNDTDNATTLGVVYTPIQNVQLQLDSTWYSDEGGPTSAAGDNLTTLMLFASF